MSLRLAWSDRDGDACLRITGWAPDALESLRHLRNDELRVALAVYPTELIEDAGGTRTPPARTSRLEPVRGHYEIDTDGVSFVPRFPFLAGQSCTVLVADSLLPSARTPPRTTISPDDRVRFTIRRPVSDLGATTRVVCIHPTASTVPRNLLRCYVEFSAPMSEGEAGSRVSMVDVESGDALAGALLDMDPELWDPARRRLTVLLDPARIKRGLAPNREMGYPLREGATVELVVDAGIRDAQGRPLVTTAVQRYSVGGDVRMRVEPDGWQLVVPQAATADPLTVRFDRPLDHGMLAHALAVVGSDGRASTGTATIGRDDMEWTFQPSAPWHPVTHRIVVDVRLEDVAGNSVRRVFDRDLTEDTGAPPATTTVDREFTPR